MLRCRTIDPIHAERGVTLLELMLAVMMLGIFGVVIHQTALVGLRTVNAADERESVRQELSNALDLFTREARMAMNVDFSTSTRFQFDADFDGDGSSTGNETNIDYRLQSGSFDRTYGGNTVTLVEDADSLDFNYTDGTGSSMSEPVTGGNQADIRVVELVITGKNDDASLTMTSSVFLDNM